MISAAFLAIVFLFISILHFYWASGGQWAFKSVLPTKENGELVMNPRTIDSIMVGVYLLLIAVYFFLILIQYIPNHLDAKLILGIGWFVSIIFMLRAIGDFRYVGFFKKVKGTLFSENDTKYFSPLCLLIGALGIITMLKL